MFDITTLAVADTAFLHLKDAKGDLLFTTDKKPIGITVYGPSSPAYAIIEGKQTNRAVRRRNDNEGKLSLPSPDEARIEVAEDLAAITVSFDNLAYPPAAGVQGEELFRALYADPKLGFITNQVGKFVANWGNFTGGSPTS